MSNVILLTLYCLLTMTIPTHHLLAQVADKYGLDVSAIQFLRQSANVVYEWNQGAQAYILRLTSCSQRDATMILSEIAFMNHLAKHDAPVPRVVPSLAGHLVEQVGESEGAYLAVVFEKLPGIHPTGTLLTDEVLHKWGQALGKLHRVGKSYQPAEPSLGRAHWYDLDVFHLDQYIPASQPLILAKCRQMLAKLKQLPTDTNGYGLIHADPEPWNFFLHAGEITFIDFDESCYGWFAFDLAVSLLYAVKAANFKGYALSARHAWRCLYAGYVTENQLTPFWLRQIPLFLQLRVMEDYAFHLTIYDLTALEVWQAEMLREQRETIEQERPVLDITFN